MDTTDLINDEDLDVELMSTPSRGNSAAGAARGASAAGSAKQAAAELLSSMEGLSARERNRLKRKAKGMGRSDSIRGSDGASGGGGKAGPPNPVLSRQASMSAPPALISTNSTGASDGVAAGATADEDQWKDICDGAWPLQWAADQMLVDILDPAWEVRMHCVTTFSKSVWVMSTSLFPGYDGRKVDIEHALTNLHQRDVSILTQVMCKWLRFCRSGMAQRWAFVSCCVCRLDQWQ